MINRRGDLMFCVDGASGSQSAETYNEYSLFDKLLELIFNVTPVLMAVSTIKDGIMLKVNKTWLDTLEYNYSEVIGKNSRELNIFTNFSERQRVGEFISKYGVVRNEELSIRTKTGKILVCLFSGDIINIGGEKYFLTTAVDITERKKIEDRIQKVERLNLLGQMAASISHEIRNPLNSVYGMLQLLKSRDSKNKYKKEHEIMIKELLRANSTIDEFLSLGRDKPVKIEKCNIKDIVQKLSPLISSDAIMNMKNVEFELDDIPDLYLDEGEMRQLILNMVRNGLESMEPRKIMTIKTFEEEGSIVLAFKDEGKGISQEILQKIGTPFFTTKENGTGLGLAICYKIVERNNGYIKVDSGLNGTTFYVHFRK
jgi:PAS domain S-box-containing protein